MAKMLVAYFSATGVTKVVAENLAKAADADLYEIKPAKPYSNEDLNWLNQNARSTVEMKNRDSRPEIIEDDFSIEKYDVVFLGFPIWWYIAPTIINTFLEKHDFSGKTIILFATSGGSRFGSAIENLKNSIGDSAKIVEGRILNTNPTVEELTQWVNSLGINEY